MNRGPLMMMPDFNVAADRARLRGETRRAVYHVVVWGMSGYEAAANGGIAESTVSRAVRRFRDCAVRCPCCKRPWD